MLKNETKSTVVLSAEIKNVLNLPFLVYPVLIKHKSSSVPSKKKKIWDFLTLQQFYTLHIYSFFP